MTEKHSVRRGNVPGVRSNHHVPKPIFSKEATTIITVNNKLVATASDVIKAVRQICGDDAVLSCVPRSGDNYEVSLVDEVSAKQLVESECIIHDEPVLIKFVATRIKIVSFMHLSSLISDDDICSKLQKWNVELDGPIHRRKYENEDIYDGTRFMRVRFPPGVSSLPYSVAFETAEGVEYFSVRHDNQEKVCFTCLSPDHLNANCPTRCCRACGKSGHIRRNCPTPLCDECARPISQCSCVIWAPGATDVPEEFLPSEQVEVQPTLSESDVVDVVVDNEFDGKSDCDVNDGPIDYSVAKIDVEYSDTEGVVSIDDGAVILSQVNDGSESLSSVNDLGESCLSEGESSYSLEWRKSQIGSLRSKRMPMKKKNKRKSNYPEKLRMTASNY